MTLSEHRNLRSGTVPWTDADWTIRASDPMPPDVRDVAILGSGIMGAVLAEKLTDTGLTVSLFDRRPPGHGSTAASTAQIMWAMDVPMLHLAERIGEQEAARRWTRIFSTVQAFAKRIDELGIDCARTDRPTLYLEGDLLDAAGLQREAAMHRRHGLPTHFLEAEAVAADYGLAARAGLSSEGSFDLDPVKLTHGLLDLACARGATLTYPADIVSITPEDEFLVLETADGRTARARDVILACGYERATLFLPEAFSLLSTFAIATPPGTAPLWRGNVMIWEASDPYLYVRTSADGRIIAGGEDIDQVEEAVRDALMPAKSGAIEARLEALLGHADIMIDRRWSATFGSSPDGLPAIGATSLMPHVWLSAGFGGNGISFAALAGEILSRELRGLPDPDSACFNPYRFEAKAGSSG